jgi:hypothetical protein
VWIITGKWIAPGNKFEDWILDKLLKIVD